MLSDEQQSRWRLDMRKKNRGGGREGVFRKLEGEFSGGDLKLEGEFLAGPERVRRRVIR